MNMKALIAWRSSESKSQGGVAPRALRSILRPLISSMVGLLMAVVNCSCAGQNDEREKAAKHECLETIRCTELLKHITTNTAMCFYSGYGEPLNNHPMIVAAVSDLGTQKQFIVIGKGYKRAFPLDKFDEATKAYQKLLKETGYVEDCNDRPAGEPEAAGR